MKLDHGNQTIIISNKKIYDFFQKNNIDLNEIEIILERMCNMCEYNKTNKDVHQTEAIFDKMKNEIVKNITLEFEKHNDNKHQKYLTDLQNILESKSSFLSSSIYSFIETKISNSFIGLKKDIKEINHQDVLVTMIQNLQSSQSELSKELCKELKGTSQGEEVLKLMISSLESEIKSLSLQRHSSSFKGQEGENKMFDLLDSKLTSRNGYEVIDCHSQPHNLDILIKKSGYNDVRLDVKNHGFDSKDGRIRTTEIKRFEQDVINCSCHGILISLHSKICGKEEIQFDRLPNGKCVIFLSNNQYNVDFIIELLQILQFIDDRLNIHTNSPSDDRLSLSTDTVEKINDILKDSERKIYDLKTKLEQSVKIVSSIKFDLINNLFRCQQLQDTFISQPIISSDPDTITCEFCKKVFKNTKGALKKHLRVCIPVSE
tara:strand:- start:46 stop:1338 length:1293 start_codon:yes stop_codon:yes gene_type:complete